MENPNSYNQVYINIYIYRERERGSRSFMMNMKILNLEFLVNWYKINGLPPKWLGFWFQPITCCRYWNEWGRMMPTALSEITWRPKQKKNKNGKIILNSSSVQRHVKLRRPAGPQGSIISSSRLQAPGSSCVFDRHSWPSHTCGTWFMHDQDAHFSSIHFVL